MKLLPAVDQSDLQLYDCEHEDFDVPRRTPAQQQAAVQAAIDSFRGELRGYQRETLGWFRFLEGTGLGGCLADDMGLGKTVQVLAQLEKHRIQAKRSGSPPLPSIVVVPKSLVFNWCAEAARFTPNLKVVDYTGGKRSQVTHQIAAADLVVTTYATMRNDIAALREQPFHYAILDEAQAIKNPASLANKAARLLQARHRLAMTGTPIENHLGDLWALLDFLNPGMMGSLRPSYFTGQDDQAQAIDRAHRMGQQNAVVAYRMIARGTVEEKIVELQKSKRDLADAVVSADASLLQKLSLGDLQLLLE